MGLVIPFYYILIALAFGLVAGFCARCYQYSTNNFPYVLGRSGKLFLSISSIIIVSPLLVLIFKTFRRGLLGSLVFEMMADGDVEKPIEADFVAGLVDSLLLRTSIIDFLQIAVDMQWFYLFNADTLANKIIDKVASLPRSEQLSGLDIFSSLFYQNSTLAQVLFHL